MEATAPLGAEGGYVRLPDLPYRLLDVYAIVDARAWAAGDGEASATFDGLLREFSVERVDAV